MRKDTIARNFSPKVKEQIAERDSVNGWPCCLWCGLAAPVELAFSNAHFIARSQGGLGIPENGLTLCPECHRRYDQTTERKKMREFFREYLKRKHPDWEEENLYYRKELYDTGRFDNFDYLRDNHCDQLHRTEEANPDALLVGGRPSERKL